MLRIKGTDDKTAFSDRLAIEKAFAAHCKREGLLDCIETFLTWDKILSYIEPDTLAEFRESYLPCRAKRKEK